jgi:hypothetical protein
MSSSLGFSTSILLADVGGIICQKKLHPRGPRHSSNAAAAAHESSKPSIKRPNTLPGVVVQAPPPHEQHATRCGARAKCGDLKARSYKRQQIVSTVRIVSKASEWFQKAKPNHYMARHVHCIERFALNAALRFQLTTTLMHVTTTPDRACCDLPRAASQTSVHEGILQIDSM